VGLFVGTISLCVLPQLVSVFFLKLLLLTLLWVPFCFYGLAWSYPRMITYLSIYECGQHYESHTKIDMVEESHFVSGQFLVQG
jgi:hypothetical protein